MRQSADSAWGLFLPARMGDNQESTRVAMAAATVKAVKTSSIRSSASAPAGPQSGVNSRAIRASRLRQPAFWNAVAGMALALALACAVVATEFGSQSSHRASQLRRHLDLLQLRIGLMQAHLSVADRELAGLREQAAARREFSRVLAAPDGRVIRLEPATQTPGTAAVIVTSRRLAEAVLQATGLPALASGQHYRLRWVQRHGPMIPAQPAIPTEKDHSGIPVRQSFPPADTTAAVLVLERDADDKQLVSPILKGELGEQTKR